MLTPILHAVAGTPLWVWVLLGFLLFRGFKATKPRTVYLPQLFIIPAILLLFRYQLFLAPQLNTTPFYLIGMFVGTCLGVFITFQEPVTVLKQTRSIHVPGSYQILALLIGFFSIKYIFGYLHATQPELAMQYQWVELGIGGLFAGYFTGKAGAYLARFLRA